MKLIWKKSFINENQKESRWTFSDFFLLLLCKSSSTLNDISILFRNHYSFSATSLQSQRGTHLSSAKQIFSSYKDNKNRSLMSNSAMVAVAICCILVLLAVFIVLIIVVGQTMGEPKWDKLQLGPFGTIGENG